MAIRGSLSEASIADVLQLLAIGRKGGCLTVSNRSSLGRIYFDQGVIVHAAILNRRDRLGDLLVKNRVVHPTELATAIAEQNGQNGPRLGEILVRRGAATPEQIERYVRLQIEEAIYILFTWSEGTFHFEPGESPASDDLRVALNPESVLLEGARRVDEWTLIEKKIPSMDLIFGIDRSHGDPEETNLTADERRILPLLDGRRSVREVIDESGLLEFDATKAIFELIQAGFARHEGRKRAPQANVDDESVEARRRLAKAFYRARMFAEAEREFRRILESDPGDAEAQFRLASTMLRSGAIRPAVRQLMATAESMSAPAPALHNLALALEADGRLQEALWTLEEGLRGAPDDPRLMLGKAVLLTRLRRPLDACNAFAAVDDIWRGAGARPSSYYAYSALALAAAGLVREGIERADAGIGYYPRNQAVLVNAAFLRSQLGETEEAEALYRRALREDSSLPPALLGLAEILLRKGSYEEAEEVGERMMISGAGDPEVRFLLGQIAYRSGDRDGARKHWEATLELQPAHEAARTHLDLLRGSGLPEGE